MSPRPWRRMRRLSGWPVDAGTISRVRLEEKSDLAGRQGLAIMSLLCFVSFLFSYFLLFYG